MPCPQNFGCYNLYSQLAGPLFPAVCSSLVTGSLQSSRFPPDEPYWGEPKNSPRLVTVRHFSCEGLHSLKSLKNRKANDKVEWLFLCFPWRCITSAADVSVVPLISFAYSFLLWKWDNCSCEWQVGIHHGGGGWERWEPCNCTNGGKFSESFGGHRLFTCYT